MFELAIETIMKGVDMLERVLEEKKEQYSKREKAADAALDAALTDRTSQQRGILERIAALESSNAKKEADCAKLADQMSIAYGKGLKADAMMLEEQLDAIQAQKDIQDKKISRMRESVQQVPTSEKLTDTATLKLIELIRESFEKREQLIKLASRIDDANSAVAAVSKEYAQTTALWVNPQYSRDRAKTLIEIVESRTGPLDVSGQTCGSVMMAKARFILNGPDDVGLQNTPLVRGLNTNREQVVSG